LGDKTTGLLVTDNSCAKCGACTAVCPVYQVTGNESLTARGRLHLLKKIAGAKHSRTYLDIFSKCLLCDACRQVCPRAINLPAKIAEFRHNSPQPSGRGSFARSLVKKCLSHQAILAGIGKFLKITEPLFERLPADSGLRLKLGLAPLNQDYHLPPEKFAIKQDPADGAAQSVLFPGCLARHLQPDITTASSKLVAAREAASPGIPTGQACCGLAFYSSGDFDKARQLARLNIAAFEGNALPIIVLCGSCFSHLASYPDLLADDHEWCHRAANFAGRLRELSSFLTDQSPATARSASDRSNPPKKRVFYHDPCHLRYRPGLKESPRQLLKNLPWVELIELPDGPQCCGFGGLFNLAHADLSEKIAGKLIKDIMAVNPDLVVTTCSGCLIQLHQHLASAGSSAEVCHLAQIL
jgi:glycolate oxidase iron-sulfur subunit